MNPWLLCALAGSRAREIRGDAARGRGPGKVAVGPPGDGRPSSRWSAWRRRTGFALVEAGLYLLAATGPAPPD